MLALTKTCRACLVRVLTNAQPDRATNLTWACSSFICTGRYRRYFALVLNGFLARTPLIIAYLIPIMQNRGADPRRKRCNRVLQLRRQLERPAGYGLQSPHFRPNVHTVRFRVHWELADIYSLVSHAVSCGETKFRQHPIEIYPTRD